ncbi:MAG: TonB-dependent receptor, partial [Polyangia bacterium]
GPFDPNVTDAEALSEGLYARVRMGWGRHQRWLLLADARAEERWPHDLLFPPQSGSASQRLVGGVGVEDELRFLGDRLTLTAGLRLDGDYNRLAVPQATMSGPLAPTHDVEPTGRVTVRYQVGRWLALRAAAGRFVRFPTLLELFGDGAFVLPHPLLQPEKAWAGDIGGAFAAGGRLVHASLEASFFGRAVDDTIVYLPSSRAAAATNLGPARMLGVELRGAAAIGSFFAARADYAFVDARELDGAGGQIPGRPRHQLTLRADVKRAPFAVWYELEYVDRLYRDPANDAWIPSRTLHAIGASFDHKWIQLSVELRNLADLRVVQLPAAGTTVPYPLVDYFNYPLPGRAIYATLVFRK